MGERTRETLSARIMRQYAPVIAFETAIGVIERYIKDNVQKYYVIFKKFLIEVEDKQEEITQIIDESPEVKAHVERIEKFKRKRERAEGIARRYGATGFSIPIYTSFILELWNDRRKGTLTKEEWFNKVLAKYKEENFVKGQISGGSL